MIRALKLHRPTHATLKRLPVDVHQGHLAPAGGEHLRDAVLAAGVQMMPDLWPFFDAIEGLPLALIWGVNSNLLTADTVDKMKKRRPDMILACVPDRGHIPFLDEAEAVAALHKWIGEMQ